MAKYPNVKVSLQGMRRNAFELVGRVSAALLAAKVAREDIARFTLEAMQNGGERAPEVAMEWVAFA